MLEKSDLEVYNLIKDEEKRQNEQLSLIPSENFFSPAVREAVGSVFSHKYSEGNVGARYYEGNQNIDALEELVFKRARRAFDLPDDWGVNVQALSGSNANLAVYLTLMEPGDTMMGMYLPDGGHLSHGWSYEPKVRPDPNDLVYLGGSRKVNITSRLFKTVQYKTSPDTQLLDYDEVAKIAKEHRPKLLITGGTAYPRLIDHEKMRRIADSVGAYYLADIAHEAGLIIAGVIPSPVGIADVVTMTTHKTMRAGRGSMIFADQDMINKINRGVLPGLQGGPHNHNIAGICVGLGEALTPEYREYQQQIVVNAKFLASQLQDRGFKLVSGGTDKHLILIDLTDQLLQGKRFAKALDKAGIVANFNTMPQETRSPADPSALRIGTPWVTTRGMKEEQMIKIAAWMQQVLTIAGRWVDKDEEDYLQRVAMSSELAGIAGEVEVLAGEYPLAFSQPVKSQVSSDWDSRA